LLELNDPRVVLARWKRSLRSGSADAEPEEANPPSKETPSDPLAIWATFSDEQKKAVVDHEGYIALAALMSPELLIDFTDHIVGLQVTASNASSNLAISLTKMLRLALSTRETEAANALACIGQKLKSNGRSARDIAIALVGTKKGKRQKV
jgi:hypothetical protein